VAHAPWPIPVAVAAADLEDRADHLNKVLTGQNVPGGLDLRHIDALLSDLASDVTGTIQGAADAMAGRVE
jgi:hypothetical protein